MHTMHNVCLQHLLYGLQAGLQRLKPSSAACSLRCCACSPVHDSLHTHVPRPGIWIAVLGPQSMMACTLMPHSP